MLTKTDPIRMLSGVGPAVSASLDRLGIKTVGDLLTWYPREYLDASHPLTFSAAPLGRLVAVEAEVVSLGQRRSKSRGVPMLEVLVRDNSGRQATIRWFNQPYLKQKLKVGTRWLLIGELNIFNRELQMASPLLETKPQIMAIYALTRGVSSKMLRFYLDQALNRLDFGEDSLPEQLRQEKGLLGWESALRKIHQPSSLEEVEAARRRVAFEEVFWFFVQLIAGRQHQQEERGVALPIDLTYLKKIIAGLPFTLTAGQKRAVWDSLQEMEKGKVMTRLLNGDVGSGKTVVAGVLAALVAKSGFQSLLMVPTEILAKQHQLNLERLFGKELRIGLYTAAQKDPLEKIDLVIGTQAVLQKGFLLPRLALAVIDEQHRFGVRQREQLRSGQLLQPHTLSMTATPIPRTLALVLYGNLSVSFLPEKPAGRQPVITKVIQSYSRPSMYELIRSEVGAGKQVFVICPIIKEASLKKKDGEDVEADPLTFLSPLEQEKLEKRSVLAEVERLRREQPELRVIEAVHGQLKAEEKRALMARMQNGEIQVMVATSVIEVGVDIPNATIMVIEGAERFGLAQLHQLRGRVGRGNAQAYCFLCPVQTGEKINQRLQILAESGNGFEIAQKDLELRGPGELSGKVQSGLPDFRMASLTDLVFLREARQAAEEWMQKDPKIIERYPEGHYSTLGVSLE